MPKFRFRCRTKVGHDDKIRLMRRCPINSQFLPTPNRRRERRLAVNSEMKRLRSMQTKLLTFMRLVIRRLGESVIQLWMWLFVKRLVYKKHFVLHSLPLKVRTFTTSRNLLVLIGMEDSRALVRTDCLMMIFNLIDVKTKIYRYVMIFNVMTKFKI